MDLTQILLNRTHMYFKESVVCKIRVIIYSNFTVIRLTTSHNCVTMAVYRNRFLTLFT